MLNKVILQGHEMRLKIKRGIDIAADAVRPTLGPVGMTAVIEYPGLDPIECDDGVTILKNINLKDHYENIGVQKLRKAALRTSSEGGDGTATTTVLTQALVSEAFKEISNDSSKIPSVRFRLSEGLKDVISELSKIKRDVKEEDIEKIATISSLDPEVAKLIAEVIKEVGVEGVITVEKGNNIGYSKEVVKGAKFDKGFISPYFINKPELQASILEDVYIVLVDRKISTNEQVLSLLNSIGTGKSILFIADDVDSVALGTLATNATNEIAKIACVRNPFSASRGRDFLEDIAILTGATVISEQVGMKLDTSTVAVCGKAEKVVVTKDATIIIGGKSSEAIQSRIDSINSQIEQTPSEVEKLILKDRLAMLTGGIGVIRVGAYTDTEFNAKKYKFENAINATQAALQEGILAGGGSSLAIISSLTKDKIFQKALKTPLEQMAINAGWEDGKEVVRNVIFLNDGGNLTDEIMGYNFFDNQEGGGEPTYMFRDGIIDPFKVVRLALESAVAITQSLISMETAIIIEDEKKDE